MSDVLDVQAEVLVDTLRACLRDEVDLYARASQARSVVAGAFDTSKTVAAVLSDLRAIQRIPLTDDEVAFAKAVAVAQDWREAEAVRLNEHAQSVGTMTARWHKPGAIIKPGARHVHAPVGRQARFGQRYLNAGGVHGSTR